MERIIRAIRADELERSLDLIERVFTDFDGADEGKMVRTLATEVRAAS